MIGTRSWPGSWSSSPNAPAEAIQGAGGSRSLLAPARAFGIAARDLSGWLGVPLWDADVKQVTTLLGLGLAAALSAAVLVMNA